MNCSAYIVMSLIKMLEENILANEEHFTKLTISYMLPQSL